MPPASSAFDLYFVPKIFPIFTPANEIKNVQTPIIDAAIQYAHLKTQM